MEAKLEKARWWIDLWLGWLRVNTVEYQTIFKYFRQQMEAAGLTLEAVGTSEAELEELRVRCVRRATAVCLENVRAHPDHSAYLEAFQHELSQPGAPTLEELGVTEEEMALLRLASAKGDELVELRRRLQLLRGASVKA